MILEIDNVELSFQGKQILNGIYIKAETVTITGILGSNGSGKSCLLNIIFGNLNSKYKLVRIDGKPILYPLYKTKFTKLLPQHSFLPRLKLASIFRLYHVDWKNFCSQFQEFSKYKNMNAHKLSGGERRLVETYLVLKSDGQIVLLDEPFSHIAPIYIERFKAIIKEEMKTKVVLMTDHLYEHLIDICDTIYLLKNGCTMKINSLSELEDYKYVSSLKLSD